MINMERNRMYLMTEDERSSSATALFAPRKEGHVTRKPVRQPGSLELIDVGDKRKEKERPPSESSNRSWSRASVGSVPPRSDSSLSRRTMTPTKQISLQAVRRKEESSDPFVDDVDIDLDSLGLDGSRRRRKQFLDEDGFRPLSENSFVEDEFVDSGATGDDSRSSKNLHSASPAEENDATEMYSVKPSENPAEGAAEKRVSFQKESFHKQVENKKEESSSESDDDDDEEEKVKLRAPNELLMEFVDCLMKKDFPNAEKLCKMILLYEPENPEALKFKPLIEEKMKLDAEAAAEEEGDSEDDDDDEDDDSDDDDEDSDDDDDDDTSSSDEDSSEDKDDDEENTPTSFGNVPSASAQSQVSQDIKRANSVRTWKPAS